VESLNSDELKSLVQSVFSPTAQDTHLAILADFPDNAEQDSQAWKDRRILAFDWVKNLQKVKFDAGLQEVHLVAYPNVHSNNADLPEEAYILDSSPGSIFSNQLAELCQKASFRDILSTHSLILAPTEFSTTAPCKLLSKELGFRAATMPGFSKKMIPALRLDYQEINRRVEMIKSKLDPSIGMDIDFIVDGKDTYPIHFDLRFRTAHASGGRFPKPGFAGNLPSGESYIVPYEGEKEARSESLGILPVQFKDEVVLYKIQENKAIEILSNGPESEKEANRIKTEPAYANIAELGFGILADFGIKPMGEVLLDEKLGLHIAFGRSDHFGGNVGVKDFTSPEKVVHIDYIYIPETQNRVHPQKVSLTQEDGSSFLLMENNKYLIF